MAQPNKKAGPITETVLEIAAHVAGSMAATVSRNGFLQGVSESVIGLCSLRVAVALIDMAEMAQQDARLVDPLLSMDAALILMDEQLTTRRKEAAAAALQAATAAQAAATATKPEENLSFAKPTA